MITIKGHKIFIIPILFALFFVAAVIQFLHVGVYYDDYGYYSLNYGSNMNHIGTDFSYKELVLFLKEHYYNANGRLLYFFIWLSVYKLCGLKGVSLAAAFVLTVIMYLVYKVSLSADDSVCIKSVKAATVCLSFGFVSQAIHQHGTYWYSAFFLYYTPIIFLLLYALIWTKNRRNMTVKSFLLLSLLSFLIGWSVENLSAGFLIFLAIMFIFESVQNKHVAYTELACLLFCGVGTFILMKSPGIWNRAKSRGEVGNYITYVMNNTARVLNSFWSHVNRMYITIIILSAIIISISLYVKKKAAIDIVSLTILLLTLLAEIIDPIRVENMPNTGWQGLVFSFISLASIAVPIIRQTLTDNNIPKRLVLITAILSVASMAMVPEMQLRVFIPFMVISFLIISDMVVILTDLCLVNSNKSMKIAICLFLLMLTGVSAVHTYKGFVGYYNNYKVNIENDEKLKEAALAISEGKEVVTVDLRKYDEKYEQYASCMYYQENMQWFKSYIDSYYGIPSYVLYNYR